nr:hypothetical protein [Angustibacter aerolatus]
MPLPGRSQVGHRVVRLRRIGLRAHVGRHHVLGDRVDQAVLVAEQAVDRRRLHSCGLRDAAGGDGSHPALAQQQHRGLDHGLADVVTRRRGHGPTITAPCCRC